MLLEHFVHKIFLLINSGELVKLPSYSTCECSISGASCFLKIICDANTTRKLVNYTVSRTCKIYTFLLQEVLTSFGNFYWVGSVVPIYAWT